MHRSVTRPLSAVMILLVSACGETAAPSGDLDADGLVSALRAAGASVVPGEPLIQDFFAVEGETLNADGADIQLFEYPTTGQMEADASLVAPDGGSVRTTMVTWIDTPHFFKRGRLIVLYVGGDAVVLERLQAILGPQFAGR